MVLVHDHRKMRIVLAMGKSDGEEKITLLSLEKGINNGRWILGDLPKTAKERRTTDNQIFKLGGVEKMRKNENFCAVEVNLYWS